MGGTLGPMWYTYVSHPDTAPDYKNPPTFDPMLGFPNGRKEKRGARMINRRMVGHEVIHLVPNPHAIKATREELDKASIPLNKRDYCVDYFLALVKCRQEHFPRLKKYCSQQLHAWEHCENKDEITRVKEWERERRLKERSKRIACKENQEAMAE